MAVKFNIGFTIDAETLFSIVSKFLPLENLSIEEVVERPERHSAPRVSKVAAMLARADTPKIKRRQRQNAGVNGGQLKVIADHLRANGPASHSEIGYALKAAGFSKLGAGSALKRMLDQGVIRKHERGYALNVSALSA